MLMFEDIGIIIGYIWHQSLFLIAGFSTIVISFVSTRGIFGVGILCPYITFILEFFIMTFMSLFVGMQIAISVVQQERLSYIMLGYIMITTCIQILFGVLLVLNSKAGAACVVLTIITKFSIVQMTRNVDTTQVEPNNDELVNFELLDKILEDYNSKQDQSNDLLPAVHKPPIILDSEDIMKELDEIL